MKRRSFLQLAASCVLIPALDWSRPIVLPKRVVPGRIEWFGGAGDGDWGNPDNWSLGRVPTNGDDVVIGCGHVLPCDASDVHLNSVAISGKDTVVGSW